MFCQCIILAEKLTFVISLIHCILIIGYEYLVSRLISHWQFVVNDRHGLRMTSDVCNERYFEKKLGT